jgi:hypothetical protein
VTDPDVQSHHAVAVAAPPQAAVAAMQAVRGSELPVTRLLMAIRTLGSRRGSDRPVLEGLQKAIGARPLAAAPDRLEFGYVGQPWRLTGGEHGEWEDPGPGFVKVRLDFWAEPAPGGSRLHTATRIWATDPQSLRRFRRYWRVVGPGSGLIRREWLRAARRRAEAS